MKDRIRKIMESQHMTQQEFSDYINVGPATLSSIFTGRTRPTVAVIEAIKNKFPNISTDWLMFGKEPMYNEQQHEGVQSQSSNVQAAVQTSLDFDGKSSTPSGEPIRKIEEASSISGNEAPRTVVKYIDKPQRQITEIRIFYDDQTWETFSPKR